MNSMTTSGGELRPLGAGVGFNLQGIGRVGFITLAAVAMLCAPPAVTPAFAADTDGDGVEDGSDSNPTDPTVCSDIDLDTCDDCSSGTFDPSSDGTDVDGDGICDAADVDDDNDGILDITEGDGLWDTDGDGVRDSIDIDSDNDGIPDLIEMQEDDAQRIPQGIDTDLDGLDAEWDIDEGGLLNWAGDFDNDGFPDFRDTDSDGDGVPDVVEGNDSDKNGFNDTPPTGNDADFDGLDDAYDTHDQSATPNAVLNPIGALMPRQNTDGSALDDWRDTDDDGDTSSAAPYPGRDAEKIRHVLDSVVDPASPSPCPQLRNRALQTRAARFPLGRRGDGGAEGAGSVVMRESQNRPHTWLDPHLRPAS